MSRELKDKDVEVSVLRKQYFEMKEENMNKLERISIMYSSVKENAERDSIVIEQLRTKVNYLEKRSESLAVELKEVKSERDQYREKAIMGAEELYAIRLREADLILLV